MRLLSKHRASQLIFLAPVLNRTAMASSLTTSQTIPTILQFISVKRPQATMYRGPCPVSLPEPFCTGALVISSSFTSTNLFMNTTFRKKSIDSIVNSCCRRGYQQLSPTSPKSSCTSTPHSYSNLHPFNNPTYPATSRLPLSQSRPLEGRNGTVITPVATTGTELGLVHPVEQQDELGLLSFLISERAKVVIMVAIAMALCNADRVVMSVAIVPMAAAHGWSQSFSGVVQSSFLWGYLLSPIAGGALADRYGGKSVMGWGVLIWSIATLLTPWAARQSLAALLATRVVMGLAEGVAMPCMNNMIHKWFPRTERSRAVGMAMAGFHLGSVAGLMFTPTLLGSRFGVKTPFAAFASAGFVWLSLWLTFITKNPESQCRISTGEYLHIKEANVEESSVVESKKLAMKSNSQGGTPPFGMLLSKLPTWAIIIANFTNNWGYFIMLGWMPVYFNTVLGVNLKEAAWFSAVPWAMMAAVGFVAGTCSDFLVQHGVTVTSTRKIMQAIGFLGPAVALFGLNTVRDPVVATAWLTAAVGLSAFSQAGFLINYQDIGPKYAGVLHGMSNTAGTFAAIISTMGTGLFIERLGSFQSFLTLTSIMYIASTVFWLLTATGERIFH